MKKAPTMFTLMTTVSDALTRMLNGSQDDAWKEVCNADEFHFITDEDDDTCLGSIITFNKPNGIDLVIDTYGGIISAEYSDLLYESRIFADRAGYGMAASDLCHVEILKKEAS
jgi:hypothetical protein